MITKKLRRLSLVILVDADDKTAEQIQGATESFLLTNYKKAIVNIEKHYRPVFIQNFVDERTGEK